MTHQAVPQGVLAPQFAFDIHMQIRGSDVVFPTMVQTMRLIEHQGGIWRLNFQTTGILPQARPGCMQVAQQVMVSHGDGGIRGLFSHPAATHGQQDDMASFDHGCQAKLAGSVQQLDLADLA